MSEATAASTLNRRLGLVFAGVALGLTWAVTRALRPQQLEVATLFMAAGTLVIALPILRDTVAGIRGSGFEASRFYMDRFITLAVAACFATGRFVTGGVVALILVVGRILEERSVLGVREAVESLLKLSRVKARRWRGGAAEEVDAEQLAVEREPVGVIYLADTVRAEARGVGAALRERGVEQVVMLTGDRAGVARFLALSHQTARIINQNLPWGMAFIAVFVLGASFGVISPIVGALLHEFSAFFVIFNSARLLRFSAE